MTRKVADQVVDMLVDSGVKHIYAITGDSLNEVNNAIRKNGKIEWIHVRHEESGAFAASAEAQLTKKIACCAGSSGPGHVHLVNGLYDAHRSYAPVIAIASTCPSGQMGMSYFQGTDTIKLFDDCSYYNQMASTPQQLERMLQLAMQTSISKKGVSVVGLPGDLAASEAKGIYSSTHNYETQPSVAASNDEVKRLAKMINEAKRVTLFCGIGCAGAHEEVVALATYIKAPVAYTFRGKMEIEYDNPNDVGMTGLLGTPSGYRSMHKSDLLLMLGTDFPYDQFLPENIKIVQVDNRAEHLGRRAKLTMGICSDVKALINDLIPLLEDNKGEEFLKEQLDEYKKVCDNLNIYVDRRGDKNNIHPEYVMSVVDKIASSDAIFTVETGMCDVWAARYLHATQGRDLLGSFNHGSLGCAVPMSIGAAVSCPGRQVIALCGDGGLSMTLGDLATVAQYNLPVKFIVFNNRSLGMVKLEMEVAGLPDWQTDMVDPDFAAIAKANGIEGYTVTEPDDVERVLTEVISSPGAALVNIMTDPNALAMPSKITKEEVVGFMESMMKMTFMGRIGEIEDIVKSNIQTLRSFV